MKKIRVQATGNDMKVVLWERSPEHPEGEAFIVNDGRVYEVAETPLVKAAIAEGRLTTSVDEAEVRRSVGRPRKEE